MIHELMATRRSLRRRLLLPMIALGAVVTAVVVAAIHAVGAHQLVARLSTRASLAVHAIGYAAESCAHVGELQRFVSAIGADAGVTLIVVAAGRPAHVIASTRNAWVGMPVTALPRAAIGEDLLEVLGTRAPSQRHHAESEEFDCTLPLRFDQLELSSGPLGEGVVMLHLDTRPTRLEVQATTFWFAAAFLLILVVTGLIGYRLLARHVLSPLDELGHSFAKGEHLSSAEWQPAARTDEIGALARTLRDAMRAADAAHRELERLKFAFDQHSIVAITDTRGVITHANDRFCAISKYERDELIGRTHALVRSDHHDRPFFAELWSTITAGKIWHGEICNRAKDGSTYWVDSTIVPLLGASGQPEQYVAIRSEITGRKAAEAALVAAKEAAEAAALAKADFLAMMSHEIRTPMNGVVGFAYLLLETGLTPEQERLARTIQGSGEALLAVINDILDFSKIEAGRFAIEHEPMDLEAIIGDVLDLVRPRLDEKGLAAHLEYERGAPRRLRGDPTRVRQVLLNLVGNAIRFTEFGQVTVSVAAITWPDEAEPAPEMLRVAVTDTGVGIPANRQATLFARCTPADAPAARRFGGTGLGLVIAGRLVELMGGEIDLESEPESGSTFWFTLPVAPVAPSEAAALRQPAADHGQPAAQLGLEVLVAEDNSVSQELAGRLLARLGCTATVVANGLLAVELFKQRPFDLVLMDCQMPEMDGLAATQAIRAFEAEARPGRPRTPILALTAGVTEQERHACLEAGMDGFLAKPIRPRLLEQTLAATAARTARAAASRR